MRQRAGEWLASLDAGRAPNHLLHALLGRNPRAAGLAPSRRTGNGHLKAEAARRGDRIVEGLHPLRGHVDEAMGHHLRRGDCAFKDSDTAEADRVHPLEIELDSFRRDVAVHPVPPDARPRTVGRILKATQQGVRGHGRVLAKARLRKGRHGVTCKTGKRQESGDA